MPTTADPINDLVKDLIGKLSDLSEEGYTYQEIAFITDTTPAFIGHLLTENFTALKSLGYRRLEKVANRLGYRFTICIKTSPALLKEFRESQRIIDNRRAKKRKPKLGM